MTHDVFAESVAGGEHLCFMGSGREEEDQYVNMVVAHFLQRNSLYVSVARGGYRALRDSIDVDADHSPSCIVSSPAATLPVANGADVMARSASDAAAAAGGDNHEASLMTRFGKLSTVVKARSANIKEKMINYIKNEQLQSDK